MLRTLSLRNWAAAVTVLVITAGYGFYRYREGQIDRLYAEAAGVPPAFRGTLQAQAAVRRLGSYRGQEVTAMLLNIALGRTPFTWPETQREAINALGNRAAPGLSEALAILLQPHQTLPARRAAADALQRIPCNADCIRSILHYLERVSAGEPNYEDRSTFATGLNESVKTGVRKQQDALYEALYGILRREAEATVVTLAQVYGLGTDAPSKFALSLLARMQLRDACPALLQSEQLIKQSSSERFNAPREEIEATVQTVKCR